MKKSVSSLLLLVVALVVTITIPKGQNPANQKKVRMVEHNPCGIIFIRKDGSTAYIGTEFKPLIHGHITVMYMGRYEKSVKYSLDVVTLVMLSEDIVLPSVSRYRSVYLQLPEELQRVQCILQER